MNKILTILTTLMMIYSCSNTKKPPENIPLSDIESHIKFQDSLYSDSSKVYANFIFESYDNILKDNSDSATAIYLRARIDSIPNNKVELYKNSLKKDSNFFYSLIAVSIDLLDSTKFKESIYLAEKAKKIEPKKENSYHLLQFIYASLHDKSNNNEVKLNYINKAIDEVKVLNEITFDKYLDLYNQYLEIKEKELYIQKYNNAVERYNSEISNYAHVGKFIDELNYNVTYIYPNGSFIVMTTRGKIQSQGTWSGNAKRFYLNSNRGGINSGYITDGGIVTDTWGYCRRVE